MPQQRLERRPLLSALSEEPLDLLDVTGMHVNHAVQTPRPGRGLLLEEVLAVLLQPSQFPRTGLLETLCCRLARLHLGHCSRLFLALADVGCCQDSEGMSGSV